MKVIYVDDEKPILSNFELTVESMREIEELHLFSKSEDALEWVRRNPVDVAFLDIEMPIINGVELARKMRQINENIRIVFVTAYEQYALDAFGVNAIGYILKPYSKSDIQEVMNRAALIMDRPKEKIVIQTMPNLTLQVNGRRIMIRGEKRLELFALLVDRGDAGLTSGEAIANLWPERPSDEKTQTLYRVTFHQLMDELKNAGIEGIISTNGKKKYLRTERVDCDLYKILMGDSEAIKKYADNYLLEYSWAELRNAQLSSIKVNDG